MSEFTKAKVGFAIAILATLFTILPLIDKFGTNGFNFLGFHLEIQHLYYTLSLLFTICIYFYGILFVTEKKIRFVQSIADLLYAIALVIPPLYFLLYAVVPNLALISNIINIPISPIITSTVINVVTSLFAGFIANYLSTMLGRRENKSTADQLSKIEVSFLDRAKELFSSGYFDLSVVEAYKAIETSARKALLERGIFPRGRSSYSVVETAEDAGLIPTGLMKSVHHIRQQRNLAAHGVEPVARENAEEALAATERILAALATNIQQESRKNIPDSTVAIQSDTDAHSI